MGPSEAVVLTRPLPPRRRRSAWSASPTEHCRGFVGAHERLVTISVARSPLMPLPIVEGSGHDAAVGGLAGPLPLSDTTSHRTTLVIPVRRKASLGRRRRAPPIRQAQVVGWVAAAALRSWWKRCCGLETTTGNFLHLETGPGGNNQDQRCC